MRYSVISEMDPSISPKNPEVEMKLFTSTNEMVKKYLESGSSRMVFMNPGGHKGFLLSSQNVELKTKYSRVQTTTPYVKIKIKPIPSLDEVMGTVEEMPS